jgi:glycosyltransferase involved in cell wall biosynthesis
MCYSPIRYAWDLQHQYLEQSGLSKGLKSFFARVILHYLRFWDNRTSNGVDHFIAISNFISRRIRKAYRRGSTVIYPPVDTLEFSIGYDKEDFYLTASRMVPYKRIDLIVEAFTRMPEKSLVVIGEGPDFNRIRNMAGENVELMGHQPFSVLRDYLQRAKAFVFAAEEDFGIAPLEAQACGTPVIAYGKGGALETIRGDGSKSPTGLFFDAQEVSSLCNAVQSFEREPQRFLPEACRENAERFSVARFQREFKSFVDEKWDEFQKELSGSVRK